MNNWYDRNVSMADSIIRYVLGSAIILGVLTLSLQVWVSLVSVYFINTAMLRWDPVYFALNSTKKAFNATTRSRPISSRKAPAMPSKLQAH